MCQPHGQSFFPYKTCPEMHFLGVFVRLQSPTVKRRGGVGGLVPLLYYLYKHLCDF